MKAITRDEERMIKQIDTAPAILRGPVRGTARGRYARAKMRDAY